MSRTTERFALFVAVCCCSLLLGVGVAAHAGAAPLGSPTGSGATSGTWVPVFTWSGGGAGNDIRNSASFTLNGGQQLFTYSAVAVPGEYSSPSPGWTVESADGGWGFEMIYPPSMGQGESSLYLPAGIYFVSSNTLDCTWTVAVSEWRSDVFTPTLTLKLSGLTSGAMRLGRSVTAKGIVTPTSLAGSRVKLTAQRKGATWVSVKSVARTISATGAYRWMYKPATRGAYHMRATIAKTAAHTAAKTKWRPFKVK